MDEADHIAAGILRELNQVRAGLQQSINTSSRSTATSSSVVEYMTLAGPYLAIGDQLRKISGIRDTYIKPCLVDMRNELIQEIEHKGVSHAEASEINKELGQDVGSIRDTSSYKREFEAISRRVTDHLSHLPEPETGIKSTDRLRFALARGITELVTYDKIVAVFGGLQRANKYYLNRVREQPRYKSNVTTTFKEVFEKTPIPFSKSLAVFDSTPEIVRILRACREYHDLYTSRGTVDLGEVPRQRGNSATFPLHTRVDPTPIVRSRIFPVTPAKKIFTSDDESDEDTP